MVDKKAAALRKMEKERRREKDAAETKKGGCQERKWRGAILTNEGKDVRDEGIGLGKGRGRAVPGIEAEQEAGGGLGAWSQAGRDMPRGRMKYYNRYFS